jgi:CubicO group peptidase (beta-lactamase class C family)
MRAFLLVSSLLLAACAGRPEIHQPFGQDDPLPRAPLAEARLDTAVVLNMARQIDQKEDHRLHSLLVVRDGRLVFDRYYNGHTRETPHDLRSATKSITALLTGIAIDEGHLAGPDQPLLDVLQAEYVNARGKEDITLHHLLTMSSGLDCHDGDRSTRGQEDRMYRSRDWTRYFLDLGAFYPPGDTARYCTGGVVALGEAIRLASGEDADAFARRTLFEPMGIRNYQWARYDEGRKVDTGGHLLLTPEGLAKIGLLVVDEGRWKGEQLVPADWVRAATTPQVQLDGGDYGYLWRLFRVPMPNGGPEVDVFVALGNGGQSLFVAPAYDLVMVTTAGYYNEPEAGAMPFQLFFNAVLPSIDELRPFVPDPGE